MAATHSESSGTVIFMHFIPFPLNGGKRGGGNTVSKKREVRIAKKRRE
jgi:hypothetical protein